MLRTFFLIVTFLFPAFIGTTFSAEKSMSPSDIPRMTIDQLKAKLDNSDLAIIDVRSTHDWEESNIKIKGAVRENPGQPGSWIDKYPLNKTIVLYCK